MFIHAKYLLLLILGLSLLLMIMFQGKFFIKTQCNSQNNTTVNQNGIKYSAVIIGIDKYSNGWSELKTSQQEAESLAFVLKEKYNFKTQVLYNEAASRQHIIAMLDETLSKATPQDAILIFFSGHGEWLQDEGYWIPSDARLEINNRKAREDWVWNSTITRLIDESAARHILVIANACYSASLFPKGKPVTLPPNSQWYNQALSKPSRFLISAGGVEPIIDSKLFGHQIINYLNNSPRKVFAVSEMWSEVQDQINNINQTKQKPLMGSLKIDSHQGGEFIFQEKDYKGVFSLQEFPYDYKSKYQAYNEHETAALLVEQGAINTSKKIILSFDTNSPLTQILINQLEQNQLVTPKSEHFKQLQWLAKNSKKQNDLKHTSSPRVVACLGPTSPSGSENNITRALLYRIVLEKTLRQHQEIIVVERRDLLPMLEELNISGFNLNDPIFQKELRKLIPAGVFILGDLVKTSGKDELFLRIVDVETSMIIDYLNTDNIPDDIYKACEILAADAVYKTIKYKPLIARATRLDNGLLQSNLGHIHRLHTNMLFSILHRRPTPDNLKKQFNEINIGEAIIIEINEQQSLFKPIWTTYTNSYQPDLWLKENPSLTN